MHGTSIKEDVGGFTAQSRTQGLQSSMRRILDRGKRDESLGHAKKRLEYSISGAIRLQHKAMASASPESYVREDHGLVGI